MILASLPCSYAQTTGTYTDLAVEVSKYKPPKEAGKDIPRRMLNYSSFWKVTVESETSIWDLVRLNPGSPHLKRQDA